MSGIHPKGSDYREAAAILRWSEGAAPCVGWRRKRDSNPRTSFPVNGFQDWTLRYRVVSGSPHPRYLSWCWVPGYVCWRRPGPVDLRWFMHIPCTPTVHLRTMADSGSDPVLSSQLLPSGTNLPRRKRFSLVVIPRVNRVDSGVRIAQRGTNRRSIQTP